MFRFLINLNKTALVLNIINMLYLMVSGQHTLLIWPLIGLAGSYMAINFLSQLEQGEKDDHSQGS